MKSAACCFFLLLWTLSCRAQNAIPLSKSVKAELVHSVADLLIRNYVYPDTAEKMAAYIRKRQKEKAYDSFTDRARFSGALTNDLYSIYHDGHLMLQYNPVLEAQLMHPVAPQAVAGDPLQGIKQANFGLTKMEILNGNIGYIQLDRFWADNIYGKETVKAALTFVSHANALIIDLRTNGGGSPETVTMICSYFFKDRIHTNDTYNRAENSTIEFWTTPDTSMGAMVNMPLYLLTSNKTFSAAEEFAYNLKNLKRATVIGEATGGGAHNTFERPAGHGFVLSIPYGKAVNAVTKTNWEGRGVQPDIRVPADNALETAELKIFEHLLATAKDSAELFNLNWQLALLRAINKPVTIDDITLQRYSGTFGDRVFTFENGKLYYQRTGRPKFELEAMAKNLMKAKGNQFFKIEFVEDSDGKVNTINAYYQNGVVEKAQRSR